MRPCSWLLLVCAVAWSATAGLGEEQPAAKPPYQRLLQGDDAKKAAELEKLIAQREEADQYAEAIRAAEELLALRRRAQGADHHEAVDAKWQREALQKVAALPADQRAAWRGRMGSVTTGAAVYRFLTSHPGRL